MSAVSNELLQKIKEAKEAYNKYIASQQGIELPEAKITIEKSGENRTDVHMDVSYRGTDYHFEAIQEEHLEDIHAYLNSQPIVRAKYADGKPVAFQATAGRVNTFVSRFKSDCPDGLHLYSGFVVSDAETEEFLGIANSGGSTKEAHAEIAYLNRADAWSAATPEIIKEYAIPKKDKLDKRYSGIGTVEVSTLLQYSAVLKKEGYTVRGKDLEGVVATARVDHPGSWKACAKSGMEVMDIDSNPNYGPELRYQLRKSIP